jgi:hypothetical protein
MDSMDRGIANTLEALANLIYLARATLDDKESVDVYLAIADDIVKAAVESETRARRDP